MSIECGEGITTEVAVHRDEMDRLLIGLLQQNARASYQETANAAGVSLSTVTRRVERLIASKVVKLAAVPSWSQIAHAPPSCSPCQSRRRVAAPWPMIRRH